MKARGCLAISGIVSSGIVGACSGSSGDGNEFLPLPEREFDASTTDASAEDSDLPGLPPPESGAPDAGADARVFSGCNGALDCERVVFATTKDFGGAFGGVADADQRCQAHADQSQSPRVKGRKFMAWVSTATNPVAARFPKGTMAYVRPDGAKVANDWIDLADSALLAGIGLNEDGVAPGGSTRVWTGTNNNGTASVANCANWKDTTVDGQRGNLGGAGAGWSDAQDDGCTNPGHLYCFEF